MDYKKALHKASSLCSRQEYCRSDIKKKLEKWDLPASDSEKVIQKLVTEKFIDEERFSSFYVRDKFRFNKWGRRKIMWQLRQKGIDQETIYQALEQIDPDEYNEKLQEVIREKIRQVKNKEPIRQKAAVIRNAVSRGYEYEEIMPLVEQLLLKK
ncbi:regulatory protein RecX [Marinilabilia salmonicolor]|uniref:regulatory protein RecX n=1 Tax=Marinilabilia salmonicolor TaxID=989 RepID=UPI00029AB010|nr:regulatory protein RecX [Marinilabilia salmonicolor]